MHYRMLALDLDGTVLDPDGILADGARSALDAARRHGLRVVLCTGRRFRTALPAAQELALGGAIVVHNGVLVKDIASGRTEYDHYLSGGLYPEALALLREAGPPMVYVDGYHERTDILTENRERAHPFQNEYLDENREFTRVVDDLGVDVRDDVILMSTMGNRADLESLRARATRRFGRRVLTHLLMNKGYRGYILELLSPDSGKWAALLEIASREGIAPSEIAAVGDDANDVEMIREAGLGIAMGNAVAEARAAADFTVRSNAEAGVVEAIERVLRAA